MANHPNRSTKSDFAAVRSTVAGWRYSSEFIRAVREFLCVPQGTDIEVTNTGMIYLGPIDQQSAVPRDRLVDLLDWMEEKDPGRLPDLTDFSPETRRYNTRNNAELAIQKQGYQLSVTGCWMHKSTGAWGYVTERSDSFVVLTPGRPISPAPSFWKPTMENGKS